MEIELGTWPAKRMLFGCLAVLALVGLALLGRGVTPVEADGPAVLTPARWAAANLSRQARAETERLERDAGDLRTFLAGPASPDPVQAMLLAQRLHAGHRQGTSATAGARQALIDAAATIARYASGAVPREQAVTALNDALARIKVLSGSASPVQVTPETPAPEGALHQVFLALILAGGYDRRGLRPDLGAAP
jgi:hypothetical protein